MLYIKYQTLLFALLCLFAVVHLYLVRKVWAYYRHCVSSVSWIIELFVSYMVDASDVDKIEASRNELHNLLAKPQLEGIPVLVLGNKRDLPAALDEKEIIERMWVLAHCQFEFIADMTCIWTCQSIHECFTEPNQDTICVYV